MDQNNTTAEIHSTANAPGRTTHLYDQNQVPIKHPRDFHLSGKQVFAIVGSIIVFTAGGVSIFALYNRQVPANQNPSPTQTTCTEEAKLCPDGSAVGRTGSNCEFAECPTVKETDNASTTIDTSNWKTYRNEEYGFEVRYPNQWSVYPSSSIDPISKRTTDTTRFGFIDEDGFSKTAFEVVIHDLQSYNATRQFFEGALEAFTEKELIIIDAIPATRYNQVPSHLGHDAILLQRDGRYFEIDGLIIGPDTFLEVLSTFKLTE